MTTFVYKNCFEKIPHWPYWGKVVAIIESENILEADGMFKKQHTEFVIKNNIMNGISVSVECKKIS
jgi:hypothetical protein